MMGNKPPMLPIRPGCWACSAGFSTGCVVVAVVATEVDDAVSFISFPWNLKVSFPTKLANSIHAFRSKGKYFYNHSSKNHTLYAHFNEACSHFSYALTE
jgi:hypothetical protein